MEPALELEPVQGLGLEVRVSVVLSGLARLWVHVLVVLWVEA